MPKPKKKPEKKSSLKIPILNPLFLVRTLIIKATTSNSIENEIIKTVLFLIWLNLLL
jgi:hypothetical protein